MFDVLAQTTQPVADYPYWVTLTLAIIGGLVVILSALSSLLLPRVFALIKQIKDGLAELRPQVHEARVDAAQAKTAAYATTAQTAANTSTLAEVALAVKTANGGASSPPVPTPENISAALTKPENQ